LATKKQTDDAADALYAQAVSSPRENGSVRSSALTPAERKAFAKIARDNGTTGDAVVDALTDAGIQTSQARSFAAEMRKRENGGVTALALALPNPAGPRAVPPDLSGIRSGHMAKFVGRFGKKKRNNRSEKEYSELRSTAVKRKIPQLAARLDKLAEEIAAEPLTLDDAAIIASAEYYNQTGRQPKVMQSKAGHGVLRNIAADAIAKGKKSITYKGKDRPLMMGLVPYASAITGQGGGGRGPRTVFLGPKGKAIITAALGTSGARTGLKSGGKKYDELMELHAELAAEGASPVALAKIIARAEKVKSTAKSQTMRPKREKIPGTKKYRTVKDASGKVVYEARQIRKSLSDAKAAAEAALASGQISQKLARRLLKAAGKSDAESKVLASLDVASLSDRLRENRSIRKRRNAYVMRKRHNAGGFDAKTIGFGIAGFAGGTLVGTLLNDLVTSKISKAEIPGINMPAIPTLVAAGLAVDAFYSHSNRGFIFRRVQNIGLRYGLAAGLIFPMVARGLASKVLKFARLGAVDNFYGAAPAGIGSIYDTAFENVSGAGEYLAENGFGEYLAENGLGEYLAENGLGADVTAAPAGFGAVNVTAAPAGLGYFVQANGLGADVTAAPAGFGDVSVRAAVGDDEDTAGELDAAYLDGMGEISVQDMRQFAGDSDDDFDTDGAEMSDEDLAIEGLGQIPGASVMRMTPESASRVGQSRVAHIRVLGRSKRVPGTLIVAISKMGYATLDKVGGIPRKPSSIGIPPAPGGQANFRPAGVFAETVFGGRGFMG
jgi:hypothetical protein